jgi:hypothetical protein
MQDRIGANSKELNQYRIPLTSCDVLETVDMELALEANKFGFEGTT